ncbi:MAG TPA: XRE family transcriptional regulator [Micromonosporaceae bacterium]|nr:XRE family transcriptional regulator [Micromonosporaceae bacterium]
MTEITAPWSEEGYADIAAAARSGSDIEVEFVNGDVVLVAASRFGLGGDFEVESDAVEGLGVRIVRPLGPPVVLPWTQIRSVADPAFAQELRRREMEEARRIGLRLRALREDKNLNQKDVADLVGMSAPQLSKIESGSFDLRVSTVQSLLRAMGASLSDIAGPDAPEVSQKVVIKHAEHAGVPRELVGSLLAAAPRNAMARLVERAFGWRIDQLVSGQIPKLPIPAGVAFKATRADKDPTNSPVVLLSHTIAGIVRDADADRPTFQGLPSRGRTVNEEARDDLGQVTLESLAVWAWNMGVAVVPMAGRGDFSAAVWDGSPRPVIVLKESRDLAVYWLFDLAHELAHLALGHVGRTGLVDVEPPTLRPDSLDSAEQAANDFALEILLPDHEALLRKVRREARGSHLRFKGAVASVADAVQVNRGLLGMIAAYALTEVGQDKDRWGSATNLARPDGSGREQVQKVVRRFLSPSRLDPLDLVMIRQLVLGTAVTTKPTKPSA